MRLNKQAVTQWMRAETGHVSCPEDEAFWDNGEVICTMLVEYAAQEFGVDYPSDEWDLLEEWAVDAAEWAEVD